ncbi:MAG: sugar ABC transporter substrate-binding protein [Spirochaetia bacterium]
MKKILGLVLIASFLTVASGFAQIKVGHVVYDLKHQYHQAVAKEIVDYGKKMYGVKVIVLDGKADSGEILKAVENLIAQKVKAISVHSPDQAMTLAAIKMARAKGIPVVTTLIWPAEKIAPHVQPLETPSSFMMGQRSAQHWLAANPDKPCRVAILDFGKFPAVEILRTTPFWEGVKAVDPNAQLVTQLNGQGDTTKSMEITLDILQANPEVNIIFGANDEMALGALAACEQIGRGKMDNGKPLTEVIAGLDGNVSAMLKVFDPNCSFKLTHGAVRDVARAEMDTMMGMISGKIDPNKYSETQVLSKVTDYWDNSIDEAQVFLQDNFLYKGNLTADLAKATKK